jgi:hypothetical protein
MPSAEPMELAISYKRFSHPSQGKGRSETHQTEAYCLRKHYFLIDTYIDRGLSAFHGENTDRGHLKAVLDLARIGKIN